MKIYIASSWKNQHAVEMLTFLLRKEGFEVISWVENNYRENHNYVTQKFDFETWVKSSESNKSFEFDTKGVLSCNIFIYIGPAGKDAAAECGICYGQKMRGYYIPMLALKAKGEDFGLMRKMFDSWYERYDDLLTAIKEIKIASYGEEYKSTEATTIMCMDCNKTIDKCDCVIH